MDRIKKKGLYIICTLCGIYTADMIYRLIRYICAFSDGDSFSRTVMLMGTVFNDGLSFMVLSSICAVLITVSKFLFGILGKVTAVSFIINFVSCWMFMAAVNINVISFSAVLYISVITVPLYLLSGLWCIYFCTKDICRHFLNNTDEEINK